LTGFATQQLLEKRDDRVGLLGVRIVARSGDHDGILAMRTQLLDRDHRVVLAARQQHATGGAGDQRGEGCAGDHECTRVLGEAIAFSGTNDAACEMILIRCKLLIEARGPSISHARFLLIRIPAHRPCRELARTLKIRIAPGHLGTDPEHAGNSYAEPTARERETHIGAE